MLDTRLRLAVLLAVAAPVPVILLHCGGNGTTPSGSNGADGATADGSAMDGAGPDAVTEGAAADASDSGAPMDDAPVSDATVGDAPASDATLDDAPSSDATVGDATVGDDASDGGAAPLEASATDGQGDDGEADSGDGAVAIDATPCTVDAGDGGPSCSGAMSCCGGYCSDTTRDPRNCGSCGNACSSTQFCTGVACQDAILKNLCKNPAATVALDPYVDDNDAGARLGNTLAMACVPPVRVGYTGADAGLAQDPDSGRPLTGPGNTLVAGGGSYGQPSVAYIDRMGLATVRLQADGTSTWFENFKTHSPVANALNSTLTPHHDYFLLESNVEPISGTLCFFGIGLLNWGTNAAGYYFQNNVMPSLASFTDAWYVYEWTDTDGDSLPSAGDTFRLMGSGM